MPKQMRLLTLCVAMFVYFQSTSNVALAMAGQAGANTDKIGQNNTQTKTVSPQKEGPKKKAVAADQKKTTSAPKTPDNPASYLWAIKSIAPSNNGAEIEKMIGNPKPFTVKARDARTLLIYSPSPKLTADDERMLQRISEVIAGLSVPPSTSEEIEVPHYRALGDLEARAKKLTYPGITVEELGDNKLRINRANGVTDAEYNEFKKDLLAMGSRLQAVTPTQQLYYIGAAEAASALGAAKSEKTSEAKGKSEAGTSTTVTVDTSSTQSVINRPCPEPKAKTASPATGGVDKGAADSGGVDADDAANCDASDGSAKTGDNSAAKKPAVSISTLSPDLLVFGVEHPGDDAEISEKKRILAALDFPRPEVIINTFSFQTSASQSKVLSEQNRRLQVEVGRYNDAIQLALNRTWRYLQGKSPDSYFDASFLDYLRMRFVAEKAEPDKTAPDKSDPASDQNSTKSSKLSRVVKLPDKERLRLNVCPANRYCLGYSSLFQPIRPNLTDMLLAVISSLDPATEIRSALNEMENHTEIDKILNKEVAEELFKRCNYDCEQTPVNFPLQCDQRDVFILRKARVIEQANDNEDDNENPKKLRAESPIAQSSEVAGESSASIMPLYCFREEVASAFPAGSGSNNITRLLRSTLANFLFQYKMSQQYPHDFSPYQLNQSAQALNSQLNPLIVALNRDLAAALRPLEDVADISGCGHKECDSGKNGFWFWQGHDTRFVNNGILTVRTVSGKETIVDTVTQNFFDATEPPSITDLINSVGQAESNVPSVLKSNLTADQAAAIIGALNSVKPATAKVGREFKIDITPHSLSGASAAELDLKMVTGDQADPTRYANGKSDPDNLSRVAQQTTNTKVRLESIKLFEISSFSATLQRSRKNVPIIPPGFEIPYIGSVLSFPVAGGKQFHRSTAVMSALVVPTAADLATAFEFTRDLWLERSLAPTASMICVDGAGPVSCLAHSAYSPDDLRAPIWEYNRRKVQCFGTGDEDCGTLDFGKLLPQ